MSRRRPVVPVRKKRYDAGEVEFVNLASRSITTISGVEAVVETRQLSLDRMYASDNQPPASDAAAATTRNTIPVLAFDDTTEEAACFTRIMPDHYSGGGVNVRLIWAASATTGKVGWHVYVDRLTGRDMDSDSWGSSADIGGEDVPATAGVPAVSSIVIPLFDFVQPEELFRLKVVRDTGVASNAVGDVHLLGIELLDDGD